ncbi:hypothetical protein ACFC1I_15945 [Microbacterium sp. NPDC056044]|uniref:hypothetical protein n=1 Tax=Microbacterium sp. NPDC056044 TaxID=3345690 RepID=UPI0035D77C8B
MDLGLTHPHAHEAHETRRADRDELERVPQEEENEEVQPAGRALLDESHTERGCHEVHAGKKHRRHPPLQTAPCEDRVEKDVRRHEPAQKRAETDAEHPDDSEHAAALHAFGNENLEGLAEGLSYRRNERWRVRGCLMKE